MQIGSVSAILAVLCVAGTLAQQQTAQRPGLPPGPASSTIPHDEGVVQGRIVDDRSGQPIAEATVRLEHSDGYTTATTDAGGRYELTGLPPGAHRVHASATGYLERGYGQPIPGRSIEVRAGGVTRAVNVRLQRASVISGRLFSVSGEGLQRAQIALLSEHATAIGHTWVARAETDEAGLFRVGDLQPGSYYLRASHSGVPDHPVGTGSDEVYAPTFFPNTTSIEGALLLRVQAGQELFGVDFALVTVETATVTGVVLDATGQPASQAIVAFTGAGTSSPRSTRPETAEVLSDGQFRISNLVPGDYVFRAVDTKHPLAGRVRPGTRVTVEQDVSGLELVVPRGSRVDGRIVADGTRPLAFDPGTLGLAMSIQPADRREMRVRFHGAVIRPDGTFSLDHVAGPTALEVLNLPSGWRVKTISLEGRDITSLVTDFGEGRRRQVEIVLTEDVLQPTHITGIVTNSRAQAVSDYTVVVFSEDRARWLGSPSPFVRRVRADPHGGYHIEGLPPADYLAIAVEPLPSTATGVGQRPAPPGADLLDLLWSQATRFRLDEGEHLALNLRLARTPPGLPPLR